MKPLHSLSDEEFAAAVRSAIALPDAPDALVDSAIRLWSARQGAGLASIAQAVLQRIVASLSFDSWATGDLAFGVRSVPSDTRQLLFTAEGRDIDLRVVPGASRFTITGQVLGPDLDGSVELSPVALASGAATADAAVARLDDLGEFRLGDVSPGTYTLTLRLAETTIEMPGIRVGERHP